MQERKPYIFIYAHLTEHFDSYVSKATVSTINRYLLRARLNAQRNPKVYIVHLTDNEFNVFDEMFDDENIKSSNLFNELKELGIEEYPW